ncbi:MAG: hypothetical protein A2W01_02660 [Candidatus Solincola sediminis]|uniref:Class I SAM-dependent methyltransferase n=1 Tax=Candidatus Solincola sediminis TaxID=1797199 RepID=A0A1F2WLI3_9ACTN|nr:MAG: hypothetical protein A2Y75_08375 [Candidatus Solincola sediminis]OFW58609.1 MAG: hypothetical protein A2W01_02660 [Candidatus Solincola sediminis]
MIEVNGKQLDEHVLHAKAEARKRAGLYDAHMLELLDRDIVEEVEEHVFSMIQVVYDLQRALEDSGCRLEPPADLSTGNEKKGRKSSFLRRLQTRFIRAVNEGYVQQQEKFNTFFTRSVDLSYRQLCGAMGGLDLGEAAAKRELWLSKRPQWDEETVEAISGQGNGLALLIGIPGVGLVEALQEAKRLFLAVDNSDVPVAEAQARFLPAWFNPQPVSLLHDVRAERLGLAVVAFPECLTGEELGDLFAWLGEKIAEGGVVLVALNRGSTDIFSGDAGFVRYWPLPFLEGLMRGRGFAAVKWQVGDQLFLKGEKGA